MQHITTIKPAPRQGLGAAIWRFLMAEVPSVNGNGRLVINLGPWTGWITAALAIGAIIWSQATWKTTTENRLDKIDEKLPAIQKLMENQSEERRDFLQVLKNLTEPEPDPPKKVATPKRRPGTQGMRRDFADGPNIGQPPPARMPISDKE